MGARDRALPDPTTVIPGIGAILKINRRAREEYERERAEAAGGEAM